MNTHLLALYVAAVFLAMIAPGPDMLFILATGTRGGPRAGLLATFGVVTSEVVQITAVAAGLAALFAAAPTAFTVLRLCGAAYLLYLGVQAPIEAHRTAGTLLLGPVALFAIFRYLQLVLVQSRGADAVRTLLRDPPIILAALLGMIVFRLLLQVPA